MRFYKSHPPQQKIKGQVECFRYLLENFQKYRGICSGKEFYYWDDSGWINYPYDKIKEDVMDTLGNDFKESKLKYVISQLINKLTKEANIPDHYLPFLKGYYDLSKDKFIPDVNYIRDHYVVDFIPVEYDPQASCPMWKKILSDYFKGDRYANQKILAIQQYMGYCLTSYKFNIALCLYGDGGNGKSTVGDVLNFFFIRKSEVELQDFNDQNAILPLLNSRFNVSNEVNNSRSIPWHKFKTYVEGRSTIGWVKYQDKFQFEPKCKFLLLTNELLQFNQNDFGIKRRLNFIEFKNNHRENPNRNIKDILQQELSGILNWMLEELPAFIENNGKLAYNEKLTTARADQYQKLLEILNTLSWHEDLFFKEVYDFYAEECKKDAIASLAKNSIGAALKDFESPYRLKHGTNNRVIIYKIK